MVIEVSMHGSLHVCFYYIVLFFFFKQKTAYEMRISDWSSDVCSSDLLLPLGDLLRADALDGVLRVIELVMEGENHGRQRHDDVERQAEQIGRASCRERVCQYV